MSDREPDFVRACSPALRQQVEPLIRDFAHKLASGNAPPIEDVLHLAPSDAHAYLLYELLLEEQAGNGESPCKELAEGYLSRFPELMEVVQSAFRIEHRHTQGTPEPEVTDLRYRDQGRLVEPPPKSLGRYRVIGQLGEGGFGRVYLAHDPHLDRQVALKVPRFDRSTNGTNWEAFVNEAKTTAKLGGHPGIVALHDVFLEQQTPVIVQEFIDGQNFRHLLKSNPTGLSVELVMRLMTKVVEALSFAHQKGFYHRDLKPENLILDDNQQPHITDFGLAIHDDQRRLGRKEQSGSPHYMSPERVRGESHRVDARSDLWSLGVILYELLAARKPFRGESEIELAESICCHEPVPLRQRRPDVSQELERIIGRCLAKRQSDRYPAAIDLLTDLIACQDAVVPHASDQLLPTAPAVPFHWSRLARRHKAAHATAYESRSFVTPAIIPKGLRSFDREDAYFFPALLPGPRDREGIPESIRFWKLRLESFEQSRAFPVGVLFGPSGSGKSSLLKSGVIPLLSSSVAVIYLDAYDRPLIAALADSLRLFAKEAPAESSLPELAQHLRTARSKQSDAKIVLVLDQMEQWLHIADRDAWRSLAETLRQCDGTHLQALIVVRDDFWIPLTRLLQEVEVRLVEGENLAAMDLFSLQHAERVLEWFGRAYGALPSDGATPLSEDQKLFLRESVQGLAEDGRVVSVRLSLFAAMMSARPWTFGELQSVSGLSGLGMRYLEHTFVGQHASPENRIHEPAARAVLQELLPDRLSTIRGAKKTYAELLLASGYADRPKEFQSLIALLDRKLRLITPSEASPSKMEIQRMEAPSPQAGSPPSPGGSFQLSHDYLVPSLRDWCTFKQRETPGGRAALLLKERVSMWKEKKEPRFLPSFLEWLMIRRWTSPVLWNVQERELMKQSRLLHGTRFAAALALAVLLTACVGMAKRGYDRTTQMMTDRLTESDSTNLQQVIAPLAEDPKRFERSLQKLLRETIGTPLEARVRLALLSGDPKQAEPLAEQLLVAPPQEIPVLIESLKPYADSIVAPFWAAAKTDDPKQLLPAAAGLAHFAPESPDWQKIAEPVAKALVSLDPDARSPWEELLHPVSNHWVPYAVELLHSSGPMDESRWLAASQVSLTHAGMNPEFLVTVLLEGHPRVFADAFSQLESCGQLALDRLDEAWRTSLPSADEVGAAIYAKRLERKWIAGLALFQMDPNHSIDFFPDDPEQLDAIAFLAKCAEGRVARAEAFFQTLEKLESMAISHEGNARVRGNLQMYSLILLLGEVDIAHIPADPNNQVIQRLVSIYGNHPSGSVHSATGWLLRRWGHADQIHPIDSTPLPFDPTGWRQWYVLEVDPKRLHGLPEAVQETRNEYLEPIDSQAPFHITMIAFFPKSTAPLRGSATVVPFALSDREVPWRWFSPIDGDARRREILGLKSFRNRSPLNADEPVVRTNWLEAVDCLRWFTVGSGIPEEQQCYANGQLDEAPLADTGKIGLRLPTLDEWRIASHRKEFPFGHGNDESLLHRYAWYRDNSSNVWHPVAQLRPSVHGLFDMDGNVSEWLDDPFLTESDRPAMAAEHPGASSPRSFRGGNWDSPASLCDNQSVATEKFGALTMERNSLRGFRVAQTLQPIAQDSGAILSHAPKSRSKAQTASESLPCSLEERLHSGGGFDWPSYFNADAGDADRPSIQRANRVPKSPSILVREVGPAP